MRFYTFIFTCVLGLFTPYVSEAQLMRRLKNAAEEGVARAVERRVVGEVEKATQKQLEKAFGDLYEGGAGGDYDFGKILNSINLDVDTEDSYTFSGLAEMEITSTDERGKTEDPVAFTSYLSSDEQYSAMEFAEKNKKAKERTIMIFDFKNNATILLAEQDDEKSRMAFGMDWHGVIDDTMDKVEGTEEDERYSMEDVTFEKTGKTKNILGYPCEEYKAKTEDAEALYWISVAPIEGLQTFWGKNSPFVTKRMKEENRRAFEKIPEGSLLEMNFVSNSDKSSSHFKMTKIEINRPHTFIMDAYPNTLSKSK